MSSLALGTLRHIWHGTRTMRSWVTSVTDVSVTVWFLMHALKMLVVGLSMILKILKKKKKKTNQANTKGAGGVHPSCEVDTEPKDMTNTLL